MATTVDPATTTPLRQAPPAPRSPRLHALAQRVGELRGLDGPASAVGSRVRALPLPAGVRDVLTGRPLGHALHPLLTDLPIGAWTGATILDVVGGRHSDRAARRLIGVGILAAAPTAWSGLLDWSHTEPADDEVRRVGVVHAACNVLALGLYGASLAARRRGRRGRGRLFGLAGATSLAVGGHLGGHLSYAKGVGVAATALGPTLEDWTDVCAAGELAEGRPAKRTVAGVELLLVREAGSVYALADRCAHRGGALHEGRVEDGCVTCPVHGSTYRLDDGSVVRGPSPYPQPTFETRQVGDRIEARAAHGAPTL